MDAPTQAATRVTDQQVAWTPHAFSPGWTTLPTEISVGRCPGSSTKLLVYVHGWKRIARAHGLRDGGLEAIVHAHRVSTRPEEANLQYQGA